MSPSSPLSPARASGSLVVAIAATLALSAGPARAEETPIDATTPVVETTPASVTAPVEVTAPAEVTTPAEATPPQVPLAASTADPFAPGVTIGAVSRDLEFSRRNGLRVSYALSEAAQVRADVLIYGDVADRELRMSALPAAGPGDSLAKATFTRSSAGAAVVKLPFNVAARRTLRKFYKLTVRVRLIATDAAGNESTAYKRVTLSLD